MRQKILIVFTGAMELGGIERSLLGLLDALDYDKYEVDLFLYAHHGPLFSQINEKANLLPEVKELAYLRESFGEKIRHGCWYAAWLRILDAIKSPFSPMDHNRTCAKIMRRYAPKLEKKYDLALPFFLPFDFIKEKVDADCKVGWIHTDYSHDPNDLKALCRDYSGVDRIAAVSEQCRRTFAGIFPQYESRTMVIENILSRRVLLNQADAFQVNDEMPNNESFKLLSIGRFSPPKNFDSVPEICKKLLEMGQKVTWYLIGYGSDEGLVREKIEQAGMRDHVIVLGKKENPYPYIKACDLYVQPSRWEGKCVAVREAQMINKPVVITNYATSGSQLTDGYDGVIVPMDNEGCAKGIAAVLRDRALRERLIANTKKTDYTNAAEVGKIYRLMEEQIDDGN